MTDDTPEGTASNSQRPVIEIPLLSERECIRRGITVEAPPLFDHLSPEERLRRLSPLIDLLVESMLEDLAKQGHAPSIGEPTAHP